MSRVFITGDTHGHHSLFKLSSKAFKTGRELNKDDVVIIAGDFGVIWSNIPDNEEKYHIKWLNEKRFTTVFIDGNHENFFRLNKFPVIEKWGGKVGVISDSIFHLRRGEIFEIGGKQIFCFGGAISHDKEIRTLGVSIWDEEVPNCREMDNALENLSRYNYSVDYIVTHTAPLSLVHAMGFKNINVDPTIKFLDHIANTVSFNKWFYGHFHEDCSIDKFHALFDSILEI